MFCAGILVTHKVYFPSMEYILYILGIGALMLYGFLRWLRKPVKPIEDHYTIRFIEEQRDPFNNRFEVHVRNRD